MKMVELNQIIREKDLPEDLLFNEDELNYIIKGN
jgi:hypothetical protein